MSHLQKITRRDVLARLAASLMASYVPVSRAQRANGSDVPIADMHTHLGQVTRAQSSLDLAQDMRANHVLLAAWATAPDSRWITAESDGTHQKAVPPPAKIMQALTDTLRDRCRYVETSGLRLVLTPDDVDAAQAGQSGIVLAAEGADFLQGRIGGLADAYALGLRHLGLTHFIQNDVGDIQTAEPQHSGLSAFGREVLVRAQKMGMLVDLAHCAESAVGQALEISTKPMVVSHGWVDKEPGSYTDRTGWLRRRLSLAQARKVADAGGVIGVWGLGLHKPTSRWPVGIDDPKGYAKQVLALVDKLGPDHVALGTDLAGMGNGAAVTSYADIRRVVQFLREGGLDDAALAKVSYLNYARVLKAALAA